MAEWYEICEDGAFCKEHQVKLIPGYLPKGVLSGTFTGPLLECPKCGKQIDQNRIDRTPTQN
jgi:hypothetical protein